MKALDGVSNWALPLAVWLACVTVMHAAEADWQELFDGQTLAGWRAAENPASFRVVEGTLACEGPRAHLYYEGTAGDAEFRNFEFSTEVMAWPGANSGVFFHTGYQEHGWPARGFEVQVNNTQKQHGHYLELKKTGSLYGIRNVHKQLVRDGEWFRLHIAVRGQRVQVRVNDLLVVDYREPDAEIRTSAGPLNRLSHGTFALQCHDPESKVRYRNLRVRRLPDQTGPEGPAPVVDAGFVRMMNHERKV